MPIAVHAVTEAEFQTWIEQAKKAAATNSALPNVLASAELTGSATAERNGAKDIQR
jgi:heme/copper-type cytochrome/quinol oxidase subunit 2